MKAVSYDTVFIDVSLLRNQADNSISGLLLFGGQSTMSPRIDDHHYDQVVTDKWLAHEDRPWIFCQVETAASATSPCWVVAQSTSRSQSEWWM